MPSAIDPSKPIVGNPTTASVRDNFAAAKAEIEALQAQVASVIAALTTPAIITEEFPDGTNGGGAPTGVWNERPLNTIIQDGGFLVSLTDNQFTLPAGVYQLDAEFQAYRADRNVLRLRNVGSDAELDRSINNFMDPGNGGSYIIRMSSVITLAAESTLAYEQITSSTDATFGRGISTTFTDPERFGRVAIRKLPQ